jgi:2-amino-4-hydroxy-6-hydroxymethyldihydropteridine diphosphokinase
MILIGLGANLPHPTTGGPAATLAAALGMLEEAGVAVTRRSRWYSSPAWPPSDQPRYVNGVAVVDTTLGAATLLAALQSVESRLGRVRSVPNAARTIDLDLLAYHEQITCEPDLVLPHPRLHERAFVLLPMADVAPDWRHPVTGMPLERLIALLPADHDVVPMD